VGYQCLRTAGLLFATLTAAAAPTLAVAAASATQATEQTSAERKPIKMAFRRITESQYRHTIADVFGSEIQINSRFEPEKRDEGLLAIGTPQLSLTSSGFEQYFALASAISEQALSDNRRDALVGVRGNSLKRTANGSFVVRSPTSKLQLASERHRWAHSKQAISTPDSNWRLPVFWLPRSFSSESR
jgi:hypothetical protein